MRDRQPLAALGRPTRSVARWLAARHPLDLSRRLDSLVFVAGSGRSGTTWLAQLVNADNRFRVIFEPFNPRLGPDGAELLPRYVPPDAEADGLRRAFEPYLLGRAGNAWTGQYNLRAVATRRLIKDIHSNLRLGWFRRRFEPFPILLIVRHPFAVALSQIRIGLALELPYYLADERLLADHLRPFEQQMRAARSEFARRVFQWCVETFVPLRQFRGTREVTVVLYERLLAEPEAVLEPIFRRLSLPMTPDLRARVLQPAVTTWRDDAASPRLPADAAADCRRRLDALETAEGLAALELFGLDRLYGAGPDPLTDDPLSIPTS